MMQHEQQLPEELDDTYGFGGGTPGGGHDIDFGGKQSNGQSNGGGNGVIMSDSNELNVEQKLQLAERANEIYRQQLKYMQDHLASLRSLIQDKENIIENLMLRYDLGIITQDQNRQGGNLNADEIEMEELRRKAEALAQRTILENFELREMVNELRDENFHLRNEIYELQDKINRQVLQINKLEKNASSNNGYGNDMGNDMGMDMYADAEEEEYADGDDEDMIEDAPMSNDRLQNQKGRRASRTMDHPANTDDAIAKRLERQKKHERKESVKAPDFFNDGSDEEDYMDEEALKKRKERAEKAHYRDPSIPIPNIYGDQQGSSEEDEDEENDEQPSTQNKRRDSKVFIDEDAQKKREERQKKHRRGSSVAAPNLFDDDYDPDKHGEIERQKNSPEAKRKRAQRQAKKVAKAAVKHVHKHRRKESLAEKLLLVGTFEDGTEIKSADPAKKQEMREKAAKEQRRKHSISLQQQAGLKEHFSDDDILGADDQPQRKKKKRLKSKQKDNNNVPDFDTNPPAPVDSNEIGHKKRKSVGVIPIVQDLENDTEKKPKHRRDSSAPVVPLGFEDPDVLLHFEKLKVKDLESELEKKLNDLDEVIKDKDRYFEQVDKAQKLAASAQKDKSKMEGELGDAIQSKADLAKKCAMEIMRLSMVLNTLLQIPKFKDTVQLLINESHKNNNQNGSLLNG